MKRSHNYLQRTTDNGPLTPGASREQFKCSNINRTPGNVANEPEIDETMIIVTIQEPVRVTANSGVKSGLDSISIRYRQRDGPREPFPPRAGEPGALTPVRNSVGFIAL